MLNTESFYNKLKENGIDFYAGVPDSLLKNICACISDRGTEKTHVIAANEGNAMGVAAGHHLGTGKTPLVYMQNSGLGNIVNPLMSLTCPEVYSIPMLLLIGWRGEPGIKDEPQHIKQGSQTIPLLKAMDIPYALLPDNNTEAEKVLTEALDSIKKSSAPFALIVRKNTFSDYSLQNKKDDLTEMSREKAIALIAETVGDKLLLSTTGHISRELYEYRKKSSGQCRDFLNVGSMGHVSQIALGVALSQPDKKIFALDGDGAALMHMGGMGIIASQHPKNFHHIIFNNGVHGSVGGQPTIGDQVNFASLAVELGYNKAWQISTEEELKEFLKTYPESEGPTLLEIRVSKDARKDLGRPKESPLENKEAFMQKIRENQ